MVAGDGEDPGGGDQACGDDQLGFVAEAGVGLFGFGQVRVVEEFVEDGGVRGGAVGGVQAGADVADADGEVLAG